MSTGRSAARAGSAGSSSPTTCSRSRSRRSSCSSPRSAASSSGRTRGGPCSAGPRHRLVPRHRRVPVRHRRARRARPPQPDHRPALARDHAQRREPRAHRLRAARAQRRRPDLRADGDGGRRVGGVRRARPRGRDQPQAARARRGQALGAAGMKGGAWLCLFAPLAGTVLILLAGTRIPRRIAGWVSTTSVFVAFGGAIWAFFALRASSNRAGITYTAWTWLQSGQFKVGLSVLVDPLSTFMMLIVAGVGGLIVLYSIGYMDGDDEERRYFAYISLFVFSMLLLVEGGNLLLLLAGWGMVGLSSYLLIGYHQDRPSAVAAAKKAFVMNAFGDATMALALFLLIQHTGRLDFSGVFAASPHGGTVASLIALGLLGGAVAKSAQIPLHTWLPDAMEGPTPVSALIHAATMVVAGVYLIVRCYGVFWAAFS